MATPSRAFTLIELVAVIVIVTIVSLAAIPAINVMGETRQAAAAKQFLRDATFARQHAQATGTSTWVQVSIADQKWTLLAEDPDNPGAAGAAVMIDPGTGRSFERLLGSGPFAGASLVSASFDGASKVGFDWLGRPLNSNEQPLVAQGVVAFSGGHEIRVEPGTGAVTP